jgi:hypothetical protein
MSDGFNELLELTEIERVPANVRKFLHRDEPHGGSRSKSTAGLAATVGRLG